MNHLEHALFMEWANAIASMRMVKRKLDRMLKIGELTEEQYGRITRQSNYSVEEPLF